MRVVVGCRIFEVVQNCGGSYKSNDYTREQAACSARSEVKAGRRAVDSVNAASDIQVQNEIAKACTLHTLGKSWGLKALLPWLSFSPVRGDNTVCAFAT